MSNVYDQAMRKSLINTWVSLLHNANIKFKEDLVRIEYLSNADERMKWQASGLPNDDFCIENVDIVAAKHFSNMNSDKALKRPILFSNRLKKDYLPVDQDELREYVKNKLKEFNKQELNVPLVLFDQALEQMLIIDRVFRQTQSHLLLIGVSGAGKTTLSRFVAWINGLSVFQIRIHNKYSSEDFDADLRKVLIRAGTKGKKIMLILDESNVMDPGFLERMNLLLANGEVPVFKGL